MVEIAVLVGDPNSRYDSRKETHVDLTLPIIVIGLAVIVAIAVLVGAAAERDARAHAWRMIAEERRWNWEQRVGDGPGAAELRL